MGQVGRLHLVDLAGCERLKRSGAGAADSGMPAVRTYNYIYSV